MLNKAREHLKSAEILFCEEQYRDAVSRAYVGQPPKGKWEHPGLRGVFIRKLGEAGMPVENCRTLRSNLLDLHDARIDADYSTTEIGKRVALDALEIACNVIKLVERGV